MRHELPSLAILLAGVAMAAPPPYGDADPEPPDAQARAVAALPHARVIELVGAPAKRIPGIGDTLGGGAKTLTGQVSGLDGALSDLGARVVGQEIRVDLAADVLFAFDRADLRPEAEHALGQLAIIVRAHAGARVRVEGHTDSKGAPAYNLKLSGRRASGVVAWLQAHGDLTSTRFATRAWGETRPVAPNTKPDGSDNPTGRQKNRRVEVVIELRHS